MLQLAAAGAVVCAVEHTDGTASRAVRADGVELPFSPGRLAPRAQLERRAAELIAAAHALGGGSDGGGAAPTTTLPQGALPPIARGAVFLGGHSYGAPSALLAAAQLEDDAAAARSGGGGGGGVASAAAAAPSPVAGVACRGVLLHDPANGMARGADALARALESPIVSFTSDE